MTKPQPTQGGPDDRNFTLPDTNSSRRQFLLNTGAAGLIAFGLPSCNKIWDQVHKPGDKDDTIDLGAGDIGILNYCYLLQQLEAAFYTQVIQNPFEGIRAEETQTFISLYNHEIAHREFYKKLLGNDGIANLEFRFKTIDFTKKDVVLQTARTFEDLVIKGYNGVASKIVEIRYLTNNAKVVSVDARHAAVVANLYGFRSFADEVNIGGTDDSWTPAQVMAVAQLYIVNNIDFDGISF